MEFYRTFIQQLSFDGKKYEKGDVVDIYETFHIAVEEFPFRYIPEAKELPTRDWVDESGLDVYCGGERIFKDYELSVVFLYKGTHETMKEDLQRFIDFLYGRNDQSVGFLLAIYDEHVKQGRKNVRLDSIDPDLYLDDDSDAETLARFSAKFHVDDPITEVYPVKEAGAIKELSW